MKIKIIDFCTALLVGSLTGLLNGGNAFAQRQPSAKVAALSIEGKMLVQIIGEVKAVDPDAQRVTVVNAQGQETQLNVGQEMQDLNKLPIGTRVNSTALRAVTLTPVKAQPLQEMLPGQTQFVGQVTGADSATGVVMLKDANSLPIEIRTTHPGDAAALASGATVKVVWKSVPKR
ncbi:hypothetical protein [Caballeronia sp. GAFFF2]|uniref:hypothetical protein n=1 Tax=Caballeronia sp. GAFFF2 TaxID=2921741 RepID=UPI0020278B09|nr:hypothetical protein [Caballeronia sp. GAFFF2]